MNFIMQSLGDLLIQEGMFLYGVEDFARRLNSDWPERMQILSLGQDRRLVTISMNSNGSTQLYTGMFYLSSQYSR